MCISSFLKKRSFHDWLSPSRLAVRTNAVAAWPLVPLAVSAGIARGGPRMIPLTLLILQAAFLFGPTTGFLSTFTAAMMRAVVAFLIGRAVGRDGLQRLVTPRLARLSRGLVRRGVLGENCWAEICQVRSHVFSSYTHRGSEVYTNAECLPAS